MRIEEITKLNLRKAPDIELYSLDLRFSQLWDKYFEKPKPRLDIRRGDFLGRYQLLVREMHKRKINHVETSIDDIVFKKEELGIDTPSLGSIIIDPEYISIVRDSKKSLRDQPDINILIRDEQEPKLESALTELFGKQINKKLNFIYDMTEWDSYIPLFEKVLRPKERIEIVRKKDDIPETGFIEILGAMAQLNSPQGRHFSLLIRHKDKRILIDPAVHQKEVKEDLDFIIITQADKDHWEYLNEYKGIPVYTVGAIFDRLPKREDTHLFLKPLKIEGLEIIPIKTTPAVGTPSMGLRLDVGKKKISILPEFLDLGKAQKDLIQGTIWICGVGDYETDPEKEEKKLSFLSLLQLAEELKPKAIYLTNLRRDILKHKEKVNTGLKIWNGKILYDGDVLEEKDFEKREKWGLNKPAYRIFTFEDLKNTPHFEKGKAIVESKFDGMRCRVEKKGNDIIIMSDPEDIKGSPIKTKRLPWQVEELKKMKEDFVGDSEIVMIDKEKNECLHRTTVNALINGKFDPTEASKKAYIYIFDIVEYEGKDIRDWPIKEHKELLSKFKDSEHVHFVKSSTNLEKDALSYIVDLENLKQVEKAKDKIMGYAHKGGPYPKHIAEGVMIKLLNTHYEVPQDHGVCKWKEKYEIDCLVVGEKEIIREGKKTGNWNYELAVGPIDKEWAEAISKKDKKAATEFKGKFYNHIGKSDNTKEDVAIGSILRVASEDVNSYETDDPKYPYYKAYVSVVLQPVPEKNVPDKIFVLERLSEFTPRREALIEKGIRPAFGSPGGKRYLAKTIVSYIPEHKTYVEPFVGGGAVFFAKEPSEIEIINDLDKEIAFAYRFMKKISDEDLKKLKKKNWIGSKIHFENLKKNKPENDLERFYRFSYIMRFSRFKNYVSSFEGQEADCASTLPNIKERLNDVKIENNDYKESINYDSRETFYYLDPPYPDTENKTIGGDISLIELHNFCKKIKGKFILSLNDIKEINEVFKDFHIKKVKVLQSFSNTQGTQEFRKELLISNFPLKKENIYLSKESSIRDDVKISIDQGKIPKEIYKTYARENEPLPKEFYNDYREGEAFIQTHIRGLEPEEVEEYKKGKITLAELFEGHSIHIDDRMSFTGLKRLVQWVITDNNVESYLRMLKGELVETASGVKNVAKSFALVKPSAEEPGKVKKAEEIKEPSISKKGAKILADLQIVKSSYFIAPGEVGSSAYKYAWMGLIWRGKVKSGIGRKDYHEYFYYPDKNLPEKNKELVGGRYVVKAFKRPGGAGNYWQVWKATEGFPADPIEHRDSGYYVLVPAKDLKAMGREQYQYGRKEPVGR